MRQKIKHILISLRLYPAILWVMHLYFLSIVYAKQGLVIWKVYRFYKATPRTYQPKDKLVYVQLKDPNYLVFTAPLVYFFIQQGYTIIFKIDFALLGRSYGFRQLFSLPKVHLKQRVPDEDREKVTHVIYDQHYTKNNISFTGKHITFDPYQTNRPLGERIPMPHPMNPNFYLKEQYKTLPSLRKMAKKYTLFFTGNVNKISYDKPHFKSYYGLLNRYELFHKVANELNKEWCFPIKSKEDIDLVLSGKKFYNQFVYLKIDWHKDQKNQKNILKIAEKDWLKSVASADFLLGCTGVTIPFSYNITEAMAVGTIPVIQYTHLFHPPLEHMVNCIQIKDEEDVLTQVNQLFSLDRETITALQERVMAYYDEHRDLSKFFDRLMAQTQQKTILEVHVDFNRSST